MNVFYTPYTQLMVNKIELDNEMIIATKAKPFLYTNDYSIQLNRKLIKNCKGKFKVLEKIYRIYKHLNAIIDIK